jgi:hypothetical protein
MGSWIAIIDRLTALAVSLVRGRFEIQVLRLIRECLRDPDCPLTTLPDIQSKIGLERYTDSPDELRKLIIVAGGRRFQGESNAEYWGLPNRNTNRRKTRLSNSGKNNNYRWILMAVFAFLGLVAIAYIATNPNIPSKIEGFNRRCSSAKSKKYSLTTILHCSSSVCTISENGIWNNKKYQYVSQFNPDDINFPDHKFSYNTDGDGNAIFNEIKISCAAGNCFDIKHSNSKETRQIYRFTDAGCVKEFAGIIDHW